LSPPWITGPQLLWGFIKITNRKLLNTEFWYENLKAKVQWEDVDVDGRIIFKIFWEEYYVRALTVFIWIRIRPVDRLLCTRE
jgi:hypothetical protein